MTRALENKLEAVLADVAREQRAPAALEHARPASLTDAERKALARNRFNHWSALTDATSVTDGKLRLQVLISELEHRGYESAARCLATDLDALIVHLRDPLRHRRGGAARTCSSDRSARSAGSLK